MIAYCDRLSWPVAVFALRQRLAGAWPRATQVLLLDGPVRGHIGRALAGVLAMSGCCVREVAFFAGHLRTPSGEAVRPAARKAAFVLADRSAESVIRRSPTLRAINDSWGRNTVRLATAKRLWPIAEHLTLRVFVANALARAERGASMLVITWPAELPRHLAAAVPSDIPVRVAGRRSRSWRSGRFSVVLWAARRWLRRLRATRLTARQSDETSPALMVIQEDDLSLDRTVRSQPHWMSLGQAPPFRTVVLRISELASVDLTLAEQRASGIEVVDAEGLAGARADTVVASRARRDCWRAAALSVVAPSSACSQVAGDAARLVMTAGSLATLCAARGVRAFMTCENYTVEADAMQLVAGPMGVRTLSYQYSTLPYPSLAMITTADQMVTFAPMFHDRFVFPGYTPPAFVDGGYVYASQFRHVRPLAAARRARMAAAGATFVVGVFDESVQRDKYGLVDATEYEAELMDLLEWLRRDSTLGIVFKTQFQSHQRGLSVSVTDAIAAAVASGRFDMPVRGHHRNGVLPAEVAAGADITIGHAIGGTASLEAALIGCRSVIVNAYDFVSASDAAYARGDIVYPSLAAARAAIDAFRQGDPMRARLGDWAPILHEFDPFQDEDSASRLQSVLTAAVCH